MGVSYFFYDIYAMFVVFREGVPESDRGAIKLLLNFIKSRLLLVAHHLFLPFFIFPIFMGGLQSFGGGDCLVAAGFLLEASTPFVSLRKILAILGNQIPTNSSGESISHFWLRCRPEEIRLVHNQRSRHDLCVFLLSRHLFSRSVLPVLAWTW